MLEAISAVRYLTGLRDVHEIAATRVKYTLAIRLQWVSKYSHINL